MAEGAELGVLLRYWRGQRGKSQLELSLDAGVSQRHLSFVESGRSVPSRELLLDLAASLDVPLRERNLLLGAAGYAPVYSEAASDSPEMEVVMKAIDRVLAQHEPHPALLLDRYWNVLKTNRAAPKFFGNFINLASRPRPRNLLHLMFDPEGLRPFVENWEEVAAGLLERVQREAVGHVLDAQMIELLQILRRYSGVERVKTAKRTVGPMVPIHFVNEGQRWSYFSLITTVGTPVCVTAQEMRIECMFPMHGAAI